MVDKLAYLEIKLSGSKGNFELSPVNYDIQEIISIWAEAEFYFYGKVTHADGKDKANIQLYIEDLGIIRLETPISFLEKYKDNLLYKTLGIRAVGKQNAETGKIDATTLTFIELVDYQPKYDELYLKSLRDKAKKSWLRNIHADNWLTEIRGGYEA